MIFKRLKILGLVSIVAFISYWAYKDFHQGLTGKGEVLEGQEYLYPHLDVKKMDQIKVSNPKVSIELVKRNKTWKQVHPVVDQPDQNLIHKFSQKIFAMQVQALEVQLNSTNKAQFGLDQPVMELSFKSKDEKEHRVLVGKKAFDGKVYLSKGGSSLYLGGNDWTRIAHFYADDFRLKKIYPFKKKVAKMSFDNDFGEVELVQKKGRWFFKSDLKKYVDQDYVNRLVEDLRALRLKSIVAEGKKEISQFGLVPALGSITIEHEDKSFWRLDYSHQIKNNIFAISSERDFVMSLARNFSKKWSLKEFDFTDRSSMFRFDRKKVYEIFLKNQTESLSLKRKHNIWKEVEGSQNISLNFRAIEELIDKLAELKMLGTTKSKAETPVRVLELRDKAGQTLIHLSFFEFRGKYLVHTSRVNGKTFLVPQEAFNILDIKNYVKK